MSAWIAWAIANAPLLLIAGSLTAIADRWLSSDLERTNRFVDRVLR